MGTAPITPVSARLVKRTPGREPTVDHFGNLESRPSNVRRRGVSLHPNSSIAFSADIHLSRDSGVAIGILGPAAYTSPGIASWPSLYEVIANGLPLKPLSTHSEVTASFLRQTKIVCFREEIDLDQCFLSRLALDFFSGP